MRGVNGLLPVADGLWAAQSGLSFFGFRITTRMVVARLGHGLWVHSPVPLDPVRVALDALGPVEWRVAPNLMHHLYQAPYQKAYPASRLVAPEGLAAKRPDLRIDLTRPPAEWADVLDWQAIGGNPMLDETVFLHRPSRSMILTDLAVHMGPWDHWMTRLYARIGGCYGRLGLSFALKSMYKDREAARASVSKVLDWDFDRVVPAHGPIVETCGKAALRTAFAWLLEK